MVEQKTQVVCKCGNVFSTYRKYLEQGRGKYCSKPCMYKYRPPLKRLKYTKPKSHPAWFKKGEVEYMRARSNVPTICGIYKITNPSGEVYIGSSRTIYRRWLRHREAKKNIKIHESIRKFGWRAHVFEIAHQLPSDIDASMLLSYEQLYIDAYIDCGFAVLNNRNAETHKKIIK